MIRAGKTLFDTILYISVLNVQRLQYIMIENRLLLQHIYVVVVVVVVVAVVVLFVLDVSIIR